jgi:UDP-N-acetylmuramate dehydrogenase
VLVPTQVLLAQYTTLRLGGPARYFARADSDDDLIAVVSDADRNGEPVLVLGGGSNLVVADAGFAGSVVQVATSGLQVRRAGDDRVDLTVAAGQSWAELVDFAVAEDFAGIECLAGIPGLAGATPIQNVGAYGQEVAATISAVQVYDRASGSVATMRGEQCQFGYRTSMFKSTPWPPAAGSPGPTGRYVVLAVTFTLARDRYSMPVKYAELAARLGVRVGDRVSLAAVRDAVLALRAGKGMVLDPADPDSISAGSFFTNPVLDASQFAELERLVAVRSPGRKVPFFPADAGAESRAGAGTGLVKVPAAWLIEQAGFTKGFQGAGGVRISTKHTLALTNPGGGSTADLIALARQVVAGVRDAFGVELTSEPTIVGVRL